jgi:uncharacterized protein YciI
LEVIMAADRQPRRPGDPPEQMTQLYFGLMKKGSTWSPESTPETTANQRQHLENMDRLSKAGHLLLSGPTPEAGELRGIVILQAESLEGARAHFADDAHIKSGRLILEMHSLLVDSERIRLPLLAEGS